LNHSEPPFLWNSAWKTLAQNVLVRRSGLKTGKQDTSNIQSEEKVHDADSSPPSQQNLEGSRVFLELLSDKKSASPSAFNAQGVGDPH
jgi:hypothetical protein